MWETTHEEVWYAQPGRFTTSRPHPEASVRLHYLDSLRVLAVFMVFLFHCSRPFTLGGAEIVNAETSLVATLFFTAFLAPWGMPFFFLLAGAGVWFALQRRTAASLRRAVPPPAHSFPDRLRAVTPLQACSSGCSRSELERTRVLTCNSLSCALTAGTLPCSAG